jgi:hypothetical protein
MLPAVVLATDRPMTVSTVAEGTVISDAGDVPTFFDT